MRSIGKQFIEPFISSFALALIGLIELLGGLLQLLLQLFLLFWGELLKFLGVELFHLLHEFGIGLHAAFLHGLDCLRKFLCGAGSLVFIESRVLSQRF